MINSVFFPNDMHDLCEHQFIPRYQTIPTHTETSRIVQLQLPGRRVFHRDDVVFTAADVLHS